MENAKFCQYPDRVPALKAWSVLALCKVTRVYRVKKVVPQVTTPVLFGQEFFVLRLDLIVKGTPLHNMWIHDSTDF